MRLIVNTNRIIAALLKNSFSRRIIMSRKFELITIGFANAEIKEHKKEILNKAKISESEFDRLISIFFRRIYIVEDFVINNKRNQAREIMDRIDHDDSPFIALALSVKNDGIWSDDKHFLQQKVVKVWRTADLSKYVK